MRDTELVALHLVYSLCSSSLCFAIGHSEEFPERVAQLGLLFHALLLHALLVVHALHFQAHLFQAMLTRRRFVKQFIMVTFHVLETSRLLVAMRINWQRFLTEYSGWPYERLSGHPEWLSGHREWLSWHERCQMKHS